MRLSADGLVRGYACQLPPSTVCLSPVVLSASRGAAHSGRSFPVPNGVFLLAK